MSAATTTSNPTTNESGLSRFLKSFRKEVRRALELAGAPYKDGFLPPL